MLVSIYLGLCRPADPDGGHEAAGALISGNLGMAVLVSLVHGAAMIAAGGVLAWSVYRASSAIWPLRPTPWPTSLSA